MDFKPFIDIGELQSIRNYHYTIQGLLSTPDDSKNEFDGEFLDFRGGDPLISATARPFDAPDSPILDAVHPDNVFSIARCMEESPGPEEEKDDGKLESEWLPPSANTAQNAGKRKQRRYRYVWFIIWQIKRKK